MLTFPLAPVAGRGFHLACEISQHLLDRLAKHVFTGSHSSQSVYDGFGGSLYSTNTRLTFVYWMDFLDRRSVSYLLCNFAVSLSSSIIKSTFKSNTLVHNQKLDDISRDKR